MLASHSAPLNESRGAACIVTAPFVASTSEPLCALSLLREALSTKGTIARPVAAETRAANRQIISTLYPDFKKDQTAWSGY